MSKRRKTPNADERATFVIHHQLIYGALLAVYLLLDCLHNLLDLLNAFFVKSIVQIDTQANEHDSERSDLTSKFLLLNLDEGDGTFCNVTFDLFLRELKVTDSKLRHNLHDVRFDLDPPASELEI